MFEKIIQTSFILALLLFLPSIMSGYKVPMWFKIIVLLLGCGGVITFFFGSLIKIWY